MNSSSVGARVLEARRIAGLSQAQLASAADISQPTISRIESDAVAPTFGDVCAIARVTRAPLLFLATGYGQSGLGVGALVSQLHAYGLRDMDVAEAPILGESRSFEELVAASARLASPRLLEAIPGLLLRNEFSTTELNAYTRKEAVRHRIGWLAEIAFSIGGKRELAAAVRPHAQERLERVFRPAWEMRRKRFKLKSAFDWDPLDRTLPAGTQAEKDRALKRWAADAPPITRKWRVADATPERNFLERARGILRG